MHIKILRTIQNVALSDGETTGHGTFGTVINCMDGQTHIPVADWLKKEFHLDYVDTITEPGPNKILAERAEEHTLESIRKRVNISVQKHGSRLVAVACHHDCAGNPVSKDVQLAHVTATLKTVASW